MHVFMCVQERGVVRCVCVRVCMCLNVCSGEEERGRAVTEEQWGEGEDRTREEEEVLKSADKSA